jgi:putative serine protease PepD
VYPLEVVANGRRQVFDAGTTVVCGRSPDAQVLLTDRRVGRVHATLSFTDGAWLVRDGNSRNGTWLEGRRIEQQRIDQRTTLHLGNPADGALVLVIPRPIASTPDGQLPAPSPAPVPADERTGLPGDGATPVLVVRLGSRTQVFEIGTPVRIGREAHLEAVSENPLVSRDYHALLTSDTEGATYTDQSSHGTFHNGRRLKGPYRITEPVVLRLGDPATGEELGVTPPLTTDRMAGISRRRARRRLAAVAAAVLVVVAATSAVIAATVGDDSGALPATLSAELLQRAETATVRLLMGDDKNYQGSGSGTVISPDGLILTNAHVAAPRAPGRAVASARAGSSLTKDPEFLTVQFVDSDVTAAASKYRARVVTVDGYLDLAVVEIYADAKGNPVDRASLHLPYLKVGDVSGLRAGQSVTVLGFPGVSGSDSISVTSGIISTFVPDPLGHVEDPRFQLETTARVAHGNSGGAAVITTGELVGVPSLAIPGEASDLSWRLRSVAQAAPLIEAARAHTRYSSHLLVSLPSQTRVTSVAIGPGTDNSCPTKGTSLPAGATRAVFGFSIIGAPTGLDVAFLIELPDGSVAYNDALQGQSLPGLPQMVLKEASSCVGWIVTAASVGRTALQNGRYRAQLLAGPNLEPLGSLMTFTIGA